jgi:phosphatidylglycerophosphate synthase
MSRPALLALRTLPHALTAFRLALAPLLFLTIVEGRGDAAAVCLVAAMITDAADGPVARRTGVASRAGAWFDVWTDFAVIEAAFAGFAAAGTGPWGLPVLIALSFALFAGTARMTDAIYDPVGRYIGGILMAAAFAVVALRDLYFAEAAYLAAYGALFATMAARTGFAARLMLRQVRPTAR